MKLEKRLQEYEYLHPRFYYENVDDPKPPEDNPLRQKTLPFEFPLKTQDKNDILRFMMNFDGRQKDIRKRDYSMAAPQIGIMRRMIVFSVPMQRGVHQIFPKTFWLNPAYEKITDDMEEKFDTCLSVNMAVPVQRYKRIHYTAYDTQGNLVEGEAQGVAARVIQHEIDHLDGILITDLAPRDKLITIEEYKKREKDKWEGKGWEHWVDVIRQELKELKESYPPIIVPKKKKSAKH